MKARKSGGSRDFVTYAYPKSARNPRAPRVRNANARIFIIAILCVVMRRLNYRRGKYSLAFSTSKYSLAFLFVLGREIEITWPGVKESSGRRAHGIANRRELFSLCIFYFGAKPLACHSGLIFLAGERNTTTTAAPIVRETLDFLVSPES